MGLFLKSCFRFYLHIRHIDLIAIKSTRKAKSRAQLTPMRTTVACSRNQKILMLDYFLVTNAFFGWYQGAAVKRTFQLN